MEEVPFETSRRQRRRSDSFVPRSADLGESPAIKPSVTDETPIHTISTGRKRRWSDIFVPAAVNSEETPPTNGSVEQEADSINEDTSRFEPDSVNEDTSRSEPDSVNEVAPRRSTRIRYRTSLPESEVKELPKPKKITETSSLKDIKNYYLDKRVKRLNPSLETIYEEPQQVRNEEVIMSSRKYRRVIDFKPTNAKNSVKARKRQMRAKLVLANSKRRKKVTLKFVKKKLEEIADD